MATYESEQEQIEELKKWWKENGSSIVIGLVLGFSLLYGWRWWQTYTTQKSEQASEMYQQVLFTLEKEEADKAREIASALLSKYSNSPYAVLTTLNLAAQDVKENNLETAHARLQWILDQDQLPELIQVARLRKMKLFLSEDKIDEAEKLLTGVEVSEFKGSYAELRGDIAFKREQWDKARSAYAEALLSKDLSQAQHALIQMKLDDLGPKQADRLEAPFPIDELPPLPSEIASPSTISNNLMMPTQPVELGEVPPSVSTSQPEVPAMTITPPIESTQPVAPTQ